MKSEAHSKIFDPEGLPNTQSISGGAVNEFSKSLARFRREPVTAQAEVIQTEFPKLTTQAFERPELYRRSVGIMVVNKDKLVFMGKRLDSEGLWQMPQGGIEPGETLVKAGLRELYEETNIQQVRIIAETKEWLYYDFPVAMVEQVWNGRYRGQRQKWILATFDGSDSSIEVNKPAAEFSAWKWIKVSDLPKVAVPYKRDSR
jgi:putative (di)nucleoside polyphosphate hydrolase